MTCCHVHVVALSYRLPVLARFNKARAALHDRECQVRLKIKAKDEVAHKALIHKPLWWPTTLSRAIL